MTVRHHAESKDRDLSHVSQGPGTQNPGNPVHISTLGVWLDGGHSLCPSLCLSEGSSSLSSFLSVYRLCISEPGKPQNYVAISHGIEHLSHILHL